jgi:HAD superfamily hydrolase (TIGR01509 family)
MSAGKPQLVIFDCDGVLVDSEPLSIDVLMATMRDLGLNLSADDCYRYFLGRSISSLKATLRDRFDRVITDADLVLMRERLFAAYRRDLRPIDGIRAVLDQMHLPYCVASSSLPERIALSLQITNLAGYFGARVYSASMVAHGKPAPDLFLHAAAAMGTDPSDCIVIEDSPAGIEAAWRAGMRPFAFVGGSHAEPAGLREAVSAMDPVLVFDRMQDLTGLIASLGGA